MLDSNCVLKPGNGDPANLPPDLPFLLVEDNPGDADLILEMLEDNGIDPSRIERATRLSEAVARLENKRPIEAIILDLGLPDSAGLDTLRVVRAVTLDAAIIVLTGHDDERTGLAALAEGAEDYLVKGWIDGRALVRELRYAVERQRTKQELRESERFLHAVLDSLSAHIAILDESGRILFVNRAWRAFAAENGIDPGKVSEGADYLAVCDAATGDDAETARRFAERIREVLAGKRSLFEMEYPCHSPVEQRWFFARISEFRGEGPRRVAVAHENITERKRAEREINELLLRQEAVNRLQQSLLVPSALEDKLKCITDGIVRIFDADFCRIWLIRPGDLCDRGCIHAEATEGPHLCRYRDRCLHLLASSGRYTHVDGKGHRRVPFGCYKIGRIAADEEHRFLTNDASSDPRVHDHEWVRDLGLVSFAGYQIRVPGGDTLGVLALFAKHPILSAEDAMLDEFSGAAALIVRQAAAEHDLLASETRYRRLFESAKDGVLILEADTGKIIDVNPFLVQLLGFDYEYFLGKRLWEIGLFKDIAASEAAFLELREKGYVRYEDLPLETRDGRAIEVEFVSNVYPVDASKVIQCNIRDITARKRTEEALRESEAKSRCILDNIGIGVTLIDPGMRVLEMNRRMAAWFPEAARQDKPVCYRVFNDPAGDDVCSYCPVIKTFEDGEVHEATTQTPRPGGCRQYRIVASPVRDAQGEVSRVIEMVEDITDRLTLEEQFRQAQKMEAIGRLASGVAHDFNNVIAAIDGYCELLLDGLREADPACADLRQIRVCVQRAAALTRQLLAFSRKQVLNPEVLDLNKLVAGIESMLRRLIGEDVELWTALAADLGHVKADHGQLEQVVMNLAVNARDAMPEGGKLTIETANVDLDEEYAEKHVGSSAGPHVMLAIGDCGCGMDRETLSKIFEPFFTTKGLGKGTGLGLATVYGIATQSGGSIEVYSEPGEGTTFKIYLPRVDEAPAAERPVQRDAGPGQGETVLVVEDEDMLRELLVRMIDRGGYKVLAAQNGGEALLLCERHPEKIDLVITDVVMPQMGGRELVDRLAQIRPDMKVLFMSGYTNDAIVHKGVFDAGAYFIQKPFRSNDLLAKLREILEAR